MSLFNNLELSVVYFEEPINIKFILLNIIKTSHIKGQQNVRCRIGGKHEVGS